MRRLQDLKNSDNRVVRSIRRLLGWIATIPIPESKQVSIIFLLLVSGGLLRFSQTARTYALNISNNVLSHSIKCADSGATLWGKAIGRTLNYVHPNLSKEVTDNVSLYAPILSALIIQPVTLTFGLFGTLLSQHNFKQQQKVGELINSIKILYERGIATLKSNDLDNFHTAANYFRQSRHLFNQLAQANCLLTFKLTDIYYNEAIALFSMHRYTDPQKKRKYALEILNELLQIDPDYIEAINLRGIIHLCLNDINNATRDFQESLNLDNTQTDIHIFLCYCQKNYKKATAYSFSHLDKKSTWQNNAIHILLFCRAECFHELFKSSSASNEQKKDMLAKAIASYEAAQIAVPKNPAFEDFRVNILIGAIESILQLIRLLSVNETISLKRLFEKQSQKNNSSQNSNMQSNSEETNNEAPSDNNKLRTRNDLISLAVKYVNNVQKIRPECEIKDIKELISFAQKANLKEPNASRYNMSPLT